MPIDIQEADQVGQWAPSYEWVCFLLLQMDESSVDWISEYICYIHIFTYTVIEVGEQHRRRSNNRNNHGDVSGTPQKNWGPGSKNAWGLKIGLANWRTFQPSISHIPSGDLVARIFVVPLDLHSCCWSIHRPQGYEDTIESAKSVAQTLKRRGLAWWCVWDGFVLRWSWSSRMKTFLVWFPA